MRLQILTILILFFAFTSAVFAQEGDSSKYTDKAIIYMYSYKTIRTIGTLKATVYMDGKELGRFRPTRYFIALIPAGTHAFHLKNKQNGGIEMNFEAGKTYYLRGLWDAGVVVRMGEIVKMEPESGTFDIKQLKPVDKDDIKDKELTFTKLPL